MYLHHYAMCVVHSTYITYHICYIRYYIPHYLLAITYIPLHIPPAYCTYLPTNVLMYYIHRVGSRRIVYSPYSKAPHIRPPITTYYLLLIRFRIWRFPICALFEDPYIRILGAARFFRTEKAAEKEASMFANKLIIKTNRIDSFQNSNVGIAIAIQKTPNPRWNTRVFDISYFEYPQ